LKHTFRPNQRQQLEKLYETTITLADFTMLLHKLDNLVDIQGVKKMPAIELIMELRSDFSMVDHAIEFIFGYARKVREEEPSEEIDSEEATPFSSESPSKIADNDSSVDGLYKLEEMFPVVGITKSNVTGIALETLTTMRAEQADLKRTFSLDQIKVYNSVKAAVWNCVMNNGPDIPKEEQ
jgi:hypothetical protein